VPPLPSFHVSTLEELARQLRYSGRSALLRQIERAEAMARDVDADFAYEESEIIRRLTGYTPEDGGDALIPGEALLRDLSVLVEHLCHDARLGRRDVPEDAFTLSDLTGRWSVSRKTIERYRRRGLVARRVGGGRERTALVFTRESVEAFEGRSGEAVARASRFDRVPADVRGEMIRRAERYRASLGCTLNQAAARLAERYGRSHEGVRQILRRHDDEQRALPGGRPIFDAPLRRDARARMAIIRAVRAGEEPSSLTHLLGDASVSKRRVTHLLLMTRVRLLRRAAIQSPVSPLFARDDAREVMLAPGFVREGLIPDPPAATAVDLVRRAWGRRPEGIETERARSLAMLYLLDSARRSTAALPTSNPAPGTIDRIETDLRWAQRLRAALLSSQLGVVLGALASGLDTDMESMPAAELDRVVRAGLVAAGAAIDRHAPFHGARLAGGVNLAVARTAARLARNGRRTRRTNGSIELERFAPSITWGAWLLPPVGLRSRLETLDEQGALVLSRRYGLDGRPPATLGDLAELLGLPPMHAARRERLAMRSLEGQTQPTAP